MYNFTEADIKKLTEEERVKIRNTILEISKNKKKSEHLKKMNKIVPGYASFLREFKRLVGPNKIMSEAVVNCEFLIGWSSDITCDVDETTVKINYLNMTKSKKLQSLIKNYNKKIANFNKKLEESIRKANPKISKTELIEIVNNTYYYLNKDIGSYS